MRLSELIKNNPDATIEDLSIWGVQPISSLIDVLEDAFDELEVDVKNHAYNTKLWAITTSIRCVCGEMEDFIRVKLDQIKSE
jgi:hypothetical protein